MTVRYEITPDATAKAYWYRWRTSARFRVGVFVAGLAPAMFALALASAAFPRSRWVAVTLAAVAEAMAPLILVAVMRLLSRRGTRVLRIDSDGLTSELPNGQWQVGWKDVREIAATEEFIFILGRGINSVSVPACAFADHEEREEFLRRARRYLAAVTR